MNVASYDQFNGRFCVGGQADPLNIATPFADSAKKFERGNDLSRYPNRAGL